MDAIKNPFSPGAGSRPPELVGRDAILEDARVVCARVKSNKTAQSLMLTGLRGVGKTVLLNEIRRIAQGLGYDPIMIEAHEEKSLGLLLSPFLRQLLFDYDKVAGAGDKVKRALSVLRSFASTLKITVNDITYGIDVAPAKGAADSGDIEIDLPMLFVAVGEAAADQGKAAILLLDEVQYLSETELGAVIMAMHQVQQRQLPIVFVGAGLPILPALAGNSKSYAERLFKFPDVGPLSEPDAAKALRDPTRAAGVEFQEAALAAVFRLTNGYAYFVQEWGSQCWNIAESSPITVDVVKAATPRAVAELDKSFFRVRYDRLTPGEKRFLRAMAEVGPGPVRTGDVAVLLGIKITSMGPARSSLIKKGMIYSPAFGDMAFTVPMFDEFMKRAIPIFNP
jgi:DNA polymerase III delta prime subunit